MMAQKALLIPFLAHGVFGATTAAEVDLQEDTVLMQVIMNATMDDLASVDSLKADQWAHVSGCDTRAGIACSDGTYCNTRTAKSPSTWEECANLCAADVGCSRFAYRHTSTSWCRLCSSTDFNGSWVDWGIYAKMAPTPSPTPSPTPNPTASAVGDPHMTSITGAKFDIVRPGNHTLIHIPRYSVQDENLIDVRVFVKHEGSTCLDMYIDSLHITGKWADDRQLGGLSFFSDKRIELSGNWLTLGGLELKVVHGTTSGGTKYLNFFVKHLSKVNLPVGGILGLDDHSQAAIREKNCKRILSVVQTGDYRTNRSSNDP